LAKNVAIERQKVTDSTQKLPIGEEKVADSIQKLPIQTKSCRFLFIKRFAEKQGTMRLPQINITLIKVTQLVFTTGCVLFLS